MPTYFNKLFKETFSSENGHSVDGLLTHKLEGIWKEAAVVSFRYYPRICLEELKSTTRNLSTDRRLSGLNSNRVPPEHKSKSSLLDQPVRNMPTLWKPPALPILPHISSFCDNYAEETGLLFVYRCNICKKQDHKSFVSTFFYEHQNNNGHHTFF
jgi:hypothetical protein